MTRLALVMIARDEAPRIARALKSARPHVDRMIVLDTGSTDDTAAIARDCGAEVHSFAWRDDFSAARNAALAYSDAAWNLILDADEWIEGAAEALGPAVLADRPERAFLGHLEVASQIPQEGAVALSRSWIARVLPRGVHYVGRIHEQPQAELPSVKLPIRIGHDGYLPEALARKEGRNIGMLREEIEAAPTDGYLWFQLGKEHQAREEAGPAADCFAFALAFAGSDAPYRHALVVRAITAFKSADRMQQALALADAELPNWSHSPDYFFVVGDLYLEWASRNPERALKEFLPICEYAWKQCLELGERNDLDGSVKGRGGFMAAHNLAVMFGTVGLKEVAAEYQAMSDRLRAAA